MKMTMAAVVNITARMPPRVPRTVETLLELLVSCCATVGVGLAVGAAEEIIAPSGTRGAFAVAEVGGTFAVAEVGGALEEVIESSGIRGEVVEVGEVAVVEEAKSSSA